MARQPPRSPGEPPPEVGGGSPRPHPPEGTSELGIDIIKVERIRASIERFGERFAKRVLTPAEQRYVRLRPETFAGRWAAKEAVSKVLGLGVRGIGWRDIEVERLPTGQPAVRLHGRAAARAEQLGMDRVALSISHESDYAVAIAFGVRTAGGKYVFPLDIEERLDDRERRLLARMERLRELHEANLLAGAGAGATAGVDDGASRDSGTDR
ncbi:MAG TPA: holo-ACP synthase [Candidatus Limnocylindrales bacterium]|nr:holo-ACP synthase [Candidatus Limnocylindrales bacterium]